MFSVEQALIVDTVEGKRVAHAFVSSHEARPVGSILVHTTPCLTVPWSLPFWVPGSGSGLCPGGRVLRWPLGSGL